MNTAIKLIRARVIMTSANFSPAVASRRAKYVGDFRVITLFGAQPKSQNCFLAADAKFFSDCFSRLHSADAEGRAAPPRSHQIP